ncbi:MAG: M28 family peptidase, partial [Rhizobium sp.]
LRINAKAIVGAKDLSAAKVARINASLMRASRHLVPLNYTSGERFHPDSSLPHVAWPSLEGLRALARLDEGAPDTAFYVVHARQTRNRVAHALREANAALRAALEN